MKILQKILCLLFLLGCVCSSAIAVIPAGGGDSEGGGYSLSGTIGQPFTGEFTDGRYVLRAGFRNVLVQVRINATAESFSNWMSGLDPADQPPPEQQGPLDMPAGDGVPNIFKYALGLLPLEPSRDGYPRYVEYPDPGNPGQLLLAIEMIRSTTANVVIWMEGSPDMAPGSWTEVSYTEEVVEALGDDRERIRLVSAVSLAPGERYFLRLNIDLP
jgi:hypothetical protein